MIIRVLVGVILRAYHCRSADMCTAVQDLSVSHYRVPFIFLNFTEGDYSTQYDTFLKALVDTASLGNQFVCISLFEDHE